MKTYIKTFLSMSFIAATLCVVPACNWFKSKPTTEATESKESFHLLDANELDLYKDAHISGAQHVTLESIDDMSKNWNKDAAIVVYCSPECGTKNLIAKKLKDAGFNNVKVYVGGITEWNKLSKEAKDAYPLEGNASHAIFQREIETPTQKESSESEISASELSDILKRKS